MKLPAKEHLEQFIKESLVFPKDQFEHPVFSPSRLEEDSFTESVVEKRLDRQMHA
jgi:hypothetical protein